MFLLNLPWLSGKTDSGLSMPPGEQEKMMCAKGKMTRQAILQSFLEKGAFELIYESEKYFIFPQASILMLEREEEL